MMRCSGECCKRWQFIVMLTYAYSQLTTELHFKIKFIKLDLSGNVIWDKKVGPIRGNYGMYVFMKLPNGNFNY